MLSVPSLSGGSCHTVFCTTPLRAPQGAQTITGRDESHDGSGLDEKFLIWLSSSPQVLLLYLVSMCAEIAEAVRQHNGRQSMFN